MAAAPLNVGSQMVNMGSAIDASKRAVAGCTMAASIGGVCLTPDDRHLAVAFAYINYP